MSPSRPNGVVNFFVVNAYRVVSEFVVISGKLFREHWSTFSLTFTPLAKIFCITNQIVYTVSTVYICITMPFLFAVIVFIILAEANRLAI